MCSGSSDGSFSNIGHPRTDPDAGGFKLDLPRGTHHDQLVPQRDLVNLQGEGRLDDPNNITEAQNEAPRSPLESLPLPALPRAPTDRFSPEGILDQVLDLTDQVASTALFGPIGVGKSSAALNLLHHNRTIVKFGTNRHLMRCDSLTNSLEGFLECLSDAVGTSRTTDIEQLRSHLESSPPLILLLDGVDAILDPLAPEAGEIFGTIEEFGSYHHICLLTTSRMNPEIPGFQRIEMPTLPGDDARDAFYGTCDLGRSSLVDDLITKLDFHPLSINLLASAVRENGWDESTLLQVWDDDKADVLRTCYHQHLENAVEQSFRLPTIQNLGTTARYALGAIAAFPSGVEECRLERMFPGIAGIGAAVDVLCRFSLLYRQDGFVKMLSPFRFYFLDSAVEAAQREELIRWDPVNCTAAKACTSLPLHPCYGYMVTLFEGLPVYTQGPPRYGPPQTTPRCRPYLRGDWIRRFQSLRKSEYNDSDSTWLTH